MRRFFIILGLIVFFDLLTWFAVDALLVRLLAPEFTRIALAVFSVGMVVGLAVMIGARAVGRQPGAGLGRPLLSLLMIWSMLLAFPSAVILSLWLLVWVLVAGPSSSADLASPARVIGLVAVALPFALALLGTAISLVQLQRFRVNRLTLRLPGLPESLRGMTIVHLSDTHIGHLTKGKVLDDIVATTNQLDADLVLLTGDLINFALEDLPRGLELLRALKSRHGVYSCEGNHDLIEDEARFEAAARASGLGFLLHEAAMVTVRGAPVRILGLRWDDAMRGRAGGKASPASDLAGLLSRGDPNAFTILLAHHPGAFDAAAAAGIPLTLAGHTHGGQLMLTPKIGFGPWLYRYWSGLYVQGKSQLVVSNGSGNWFPLRIGAPAELIHLTLEPM